MVHPDAGKPRLDWKDFLAESHRVALERQWNDLLRSHRRYGCSLEEDDKGTWGPCVIHGTKKGDRELTKKEFMGSLWVESGAVGDRPMDGESGTDGD